MEDTHYSGSSNAHERGKQSCFFDGQGLLWPHTSWGSLPAWKQCGEAQDLHGRQLPERRMWQFTASCSLFCPGPECGVQRSLIFLLQPQIKAPTSSAFTAPLVNREGFFTRLFCSEGRGAEAEGTHSAVSPVLQHSSHSKAEHSPFPDPSPTIKLHTPTCRRRGSNWRVLIFVLKSKHGVLVKTRLFQCSEASPPPGISAEA